MRWAVINAAGFALAFYSKEATAKLNSRSLRVVHAPEKVRDGVTHQYSEETKRWHQAKEPREVLQPHKDWKKQRKDAFGHGIEWDEQLALFSDLTIWLKDKFGDEMPVKLREAIEEHEKIVLDIKGLIPKPTEVG